MTAVDARRFPKVDLHCHVDGAVRPATLLEIAAEAGVDLPARDVDGLLPYVQVAPECRTLRDFLATFEVFYPVLSVAGAMERAACELVEDAAADGVVHLEARFCPALQATDTQGAEEVLRATLAGLSAGARATGISVGGIVCLYRPLDYDVNDELARLAVEYADRGVVGVDLAGPEDLPGAPFAALFMRVREAGLPLTIHAGEAMGPASIVEAVDALVAARIGHGVALRHDPELAARVADLGVTVECCLTSNLHTGAVASLAEHPFDALRRAGVPVTINTDDPSVSGIDWSHELDLAATTWGYGLAELEAIVTAGVDGAFVDEGTRRRLREAVASRARACRRPLEGE